MVRVGDDRFQDGLGPLAYAWCQLRPLWFPSFLLPLFYKTALSFILPHEDATVLTAVARRLQITL